MKSCEKRAPSALGPGVMKERTKLGHKTKSAATAVHVYSLQKKKKSKKKKKKSSVKID